MDLNVPGDFDVVGLWEAVDQRRREHDMSWSQVTKALGWMDQATIARMRERGRATCNHVLPMIQWAGRTPESFTVDPDGALHELLPEPGERGWRWWWGHRQLAYELEAARQERGLRIKELAEELGCPAREASGLGRLRYGPHIGLAMKATRWLGRSAASFLTETPPSLQGPGGRD